MTIEELENEIDRLQRETDKNKDEKQHLEEIYGNLKLRRELYFINVEELKEKIQSLKKELNAVESTMKIKKNFSDDVDIEEMNKNISEIKSQIEGLFKNASKIIEFRQKKMNDISDEIEGVRET